MLAYHQLRGILVKQRCCTENELRTSSTAKKSGIIQKFRLPEYWPSLLFMNCDLEVAGYQVPTFQIGIYYRVGSG